jgi:hypothetical protein
MVRLPLVSRYELIFKTRYGIVILNPSTEHDLLDSEFGLSAFTIQTNSWNKICSCYEVSLGLSAFVMQTNPWNMIRDCNPYLPYSISPPMPGLSYSPMTTESSLGDHTVQMSSFMDISMPLLPGQFTVFEEGQRQDGEEEQRDVQDLREQEADTAGSDIPWRLPGGSSERWDDKEEMH